MVVTPIRVEIIGGFRAFRRCLTYKGENDRVRAYWRWVRFSSRGWIVGFLRDWHKYIETVVKLIVAILIALSLIGSPGAANAAPSESCTMAGADEGMAADHEKMDCCTPECATPCPTAVLADMDLHHDDVKPVRLLDWRPAETGLPSVLPPLDDPPPRAFFA